MELNTGHGTIKKLRNGMVVSTLAISALGVASGVSASETEVAVNEPATKVVAKDEVKPKVPSQADVDTAKAESDKANQDVAKQKEVVSTTEANIANAEKSIAETTKKVEEAKTVTPEKVAEAKADADKKASELATAEKTVADADKSVSATAEKVEDQTKVVSNAEKTATDASNKVAEAQNKVDSLSSTTDIHTLDREAYGLTVKVRVDERKVDEAQKKLDDGKKAVADKEQAIKDTQDKVSSAEKELKQATTNLNVAKANQSQKEEAVKKAKSALDVAKQGVTETTTQKVDKKAVEVAQKAYVNAYAELKDAERGVYLAKTRYGKAEDDLYFARRHLSDIQLNKIDVPALEKALEDAKTQLAEDKKALKTAEEVLELAKTNAIDKAKSLAEAKKALATAKAEKASADKALETAKGELEVFNKAHDVAVLARKSAGADLARKREASKEATDTYTVLELALTKRDEVLKALDKEITDANAKLGVLRAELETAKDKLARLEGIAEAKARGYENFKQLKAEHDAYLAEQQRLQALKDKEDAIRKAGGQPKEVTDATGKVVDVVDAKAQNKPVDVTYNTAKPTATEFKVDTNAAKTGEVQAKAETKQATEKALPNTGEAASMLSLLGSLIGLGGLGVLAKRKD